MLMLLFTLLQAAVPGASGGAAEPTQGFELTGSAEDPAGDTHFFFGDQAAPDLRSASVSLSSADGMSVDATFEAGTFSGKTTAVHFSFYVQRPENPAGCADYQVNFNVAGTPAGEVSVQRRTPAGTYERVGSGRPRLTRNGLQIAVPARLFGSDLQKLGYWHVVVAVRLREEAESRLLDYLPDTNLPLATVRKSAGRRTKA